MNLPPHLNTCLQVDLMSVPLRGPGVSVLSTPAPSESVAPHAHGPSLAFRIKTSNTEVTEEIGKVTVSSSLLYLIIRKKLCKAFENQVKSKTQEEHKPNQERPFGTVWSQCLI